jgi:hypothetical protein
MACNTLTSILKSCSNNLGSIYNVYINDTENVTAKTVNLSAHTVTAITASPDYTSFEFKRNVGNFVVSPKIDLNNGSTYFEVTLTLSFTRREAAKSRALQILGEGQRYLDIIVLDGNNLYWNLPLMQLSAGDESTGSVKADGSKYEVTFVGQIDNRPYEIDSSIIAGLIS